MFTWICPQCGREVPPSYSECPDCAARAAAPPAAAQPPTPPVPPQPGATQPPAPPPGTYVAPAPPGAPQPQVIYVKQGQPGWLVTLVVAAVLVGAGAAAYYFLPSARAQREAASEEPAGAAMEEAPKAGEAPTGSRLARMLEVTGLRIVEEDKKPEIRYLLVNHSGADLAGLKGQVLLRSSKAGPDDDPIAVVPMEMSSLRSYEVKEIIAPLKTKLRAYEYPDWQFLRAELKLTAP